MGRLTACDPLDAREVRELRARASRTRSRASAAAWAAAAASSRAWRSSRSSDVELARDEDSTYSSVSGGVPSGVSSAAKSNTAGRARTWSDDAEATVTTAEEWSVSACDSAEGVGRDALLVSELIWWTAELSTVCGEDVGVAAIFDVEGDEAGVEVEGGHAADHGYG